MRLRRWATHVLGLLCLAARVVVTGAAESIATSASKEVVGCADDDATADAFLLLLQRTAHGLTGHIDLRGAGTATQQVNTSWSHGRSAVTPITPKKYVDVQYFLDAECTQQEGAQLKHSAEDDFCFLSWNFTCDCNESFKVANAYKYTPTCANRETVDSFVVPLGSCIAASQLGGDANLFMLVDDHGSCPCCGSTCTIYGDPHVTVFDGNKVSLLKVRHGGVWAGDDEFRIGDYWVVKSQEISIQGRYAKVHYPNAKFGNHTFLTGLAVSGPFLAGNTLLIGPQDGIVEWRGKLGGSEEILQKPGVYKVGNLIEARSRDQMLSVSNPLSNDVTPGLDIHFASGVRLQVNRNKKHLDMALTMSPEAAGPGGMDGQCGNFNGDPSDDTGQLIDERIGYEIPDWGSLFDQSKEQSAFFAQLDSSPKSGGNGPPAAAKAIQLSTLASDYVELNLYVDASCTTLFSEDLEVHLAVSNLHCEQGLNFTCSCEGDRKAIAGHIYEPSCSDRQMTYAIAPIAADGTCVAVPEQPGLWYQADAVICPECPCDAGQSCTIHGDPHITVFDQAQVALMGIDRESVDGNQQQQQQQSGA
mmetsp:Transcript_48693/g.115717  ORF Transcript_48693/g.115717 Transcript_48693/m.115717 type:complete len:587 (+) Transcript_48693:57-1817(+)